MAGMGATVGSSPIYAGSVSNRLIINMNIFKRQGRHIGTFEGNGSGQGATSLTDGQEQHGVVGKLCVNYALIKFDDLVKSRNQLSHIL